MKYSDIIKIDLTSDKILNEAIGRLTANRVANDSVVIIAKSELGDMIKELQNAKSK